MQPKVAIKGRRTGGPGWRSELVRSPFVPKVISARCIVTDTGTVTLCTIPAGHTVVGVAGRVKTALDGTTPTFDLGDGTTADLFFDDTSFDVETGDSAGYEAGGEYLATDTTVVATVGGTTVTEGEIELLIFLVDNAHVFDPANFQGTI